MRVSECGEFGLIERLRVLVADASLPGCAIGIGDDAAAWTPEGALLEVGTTDALVEGVHFDLATIDWRDLGWKSLAVNVSDVAAMGALPRYALVSLGLRSDQPVADLEDLYLGMRELCLEHGFGIIGGNVAASATTFISATVIGAGRPPLLTRGAARAGQKLVVTGWLGNSTGGLRLLSGSPEGCAIDRECAFARTLMLAHRRPRPRVREAAKLREFGVRCGIDVSDGLLGDVGHICRASGLAATLYLDELPTHPALQAAFPRTHRQLALTGGEDYELLCALDEELIAAARATLADLGDTALTVVGELHEAHAGRTLVRVVDGSGGEVVPAGGSWRHFS